MNVTCNTNGARLASLFCMHLFISSIQLHAQNCPGLGSITLNVVATPVPTINAPAEICTGATTILSVNETFSAYSWSTGSTTKSTIIATADTYTVTVTNAGGCTGSAVVTVASSPEPVPNITALPYACNGQLTLNAGAGFASYNWSNNQVAGSITVNSSMTYTVTVTNAEGCTGTDSFTATIPPPPTVAISGNNGFCPGGSATLSATPGLASYTWSNGQKGPNISVAVAGAFTVTATNAIGCTATANITVAQLSAPQPAITGPSGICAGNMAMFSTTTSFLSYAWSTGQNSPAILVDTAGIYTLTVTAANGCTGVASKLLEVLPAPGPVISADNYQCNGQLTLHAPAGFMAYAWSTGSTNPGITVDSSDQYAVTVTNSQGCSGTGTYFANIPAMPVVNITGTDSICPGSSTILNASAGFSSYVWSTGAGSPMINVSTAGPLIVTVTDTLGCTASDTLIVRALASPTPAIIGPTTICTTGSATFSAPGLFTAIVWSTGATSPTISVNTAGTYSVTVTATNGCTGTDSQTLSISNNLQPQITQLPYACKGQIGLDAEPGFSAYTWSNGQTTPGISVTVDGIYTVTVSDASGCTGTAFAAVKIPPAPTVSITGNNSICAGASTTLLASPGLSNYVWSTGQAGNALSINTAGIFTVTATDGYGCTVSADFQLNVTPVPQPDITGPGLICTNSSGALVVNGTYSQYNWSTGASTPGININTGNTYMVTVTDALGCTGADTLTVTEVSVPSPVIAAAPYACDGQITLGAPDYVSYLWAGPNGFAATGQYVAVGATGTYTVTVTDNNGCTGTAALNAVIPATTQVSVSGPTEFCSGGSVDLTASPGFLQYAWSNGQALQGIQVNAIDTYTVTATDALGCTSTASVTIGQFPQPLPGLSGPQTVCPGTTATLNVAGVYTAYAWSDGSGAANITAQPPFTATVTVTDANGCTGTASATVSVFSQPAPGITQLPYACDGQITLDAGPGFLYQWSNGSTLQTAGIMQSGDYSLTVTDANGCTGTATASILVPPKPVAGIAGPVTFCAGNSITLTATPGFSAYAWSTGGNLVSINLNMAGTYTVTVTDAAGCTATASTTVTSTSLNPALHNSEIFCQGTTLTIIVAGNYAAYQWSNGSSQPSITVSQIGVYTVTVTDLAGCTGTAMTQVQAVPPASVSIHLNGALCGNNSVLLNTSGSTGAFAWSNGATGTPLSVAQPGTYTVTVTDANGCTATATQVVVTESPVTTTINLSTCRLQEAGIRILTLTAANNCDSVVTIITTYVPTKPGLALDLEPLIEAYPGQVLVLNVAGNFPIDSVAYQSPFVLSCANCLNPAWTAAASGFIRVTAFDPDGCQAMDTVKVLVRKQLNIYVPNIFQPGSPENGYFSVFSGPEIKFVRNFHVFDRWGNALFSREDMPTNDPAAGWDGTFRNEPMQPGVYVYYFEVLLADGSTEIYSGDVTILK